MSRTQPDYKNNNTETILDDDDLGFEEFVKGIEQVGIFKTIKQNKDKYEPQR